MRSIRAIVDAGLARAAAAVAAVTRRTQQSPGRCGRQNAHAAPPDMGRPIADEAGRLRSRALEALEREFRAPLNHMLGLARLMLDTPLSAEQRDDLRTISSTAAELVAILNDIHDLARLEAGTLDVQSVPLDLHALVDEVRDRVAAAAKSKGIALTAAVADDVPRHIRSDPMRLRQILLAVVGNAVKFTERGSVSLSVTGGDGEVRVVIADSGPGIDDETLAGLFDGFRPGAAGRRLGGAGLGLAVCRRLLALMGGAIRVDSIPGTGSTVAITLPLVAAETRPPRRHDLPPLKVLVAEDNPVGQKVVDAILGRRGHHVTMVPDGAAAVRMVSEHDFDVVLMDMQMPEMDGLEATRLIRAMAGPRSGVPIIALTANTEKGDEERCLKAGMDDFLSKPVHPDHLLQSLKVHVVGRGAARVAVRPHGRAKPAVSEAADIDPRQLEHSIELLGRDAVVEVLHRFESQAADFAAAMAAEDAVSMVRAAHGIAGCARYVGLTRLGKACATVESLWRAGSEAEARRTAAAALADVEPALARLRGELGVAAGASSAP